MDAMHFHQHDRNLEQARQELIRIIRLQGISDSRVLDAVAAVPRELFIPERLRASAYENHPLPIGDGQTISQPYTVAYMAQLLSITPGDRILEIGGGSGYNAAVLFELTGESGSVYSLEIIPALADREKENLQRAGYDQVQVRHGDGKLGLPEEAPFDAVMITAEAREVPGALVRQLRVGGILVVPVRSGFHSVMTRIEKTAEPDVCSYSEHGAFAFVPLV